MDVNTFLTNIKNIEKMNTHYKLGTYMNKEEDGVYLTDCDGLIKGVLWGFPKKGKYGSNQVPDMDANTMITRCSEVTRDFTKVKPGWLVWMKGYIGIYIGDGVVIEATAAWEKKVLRSYLKECGVPNKNKLHERKWEKCGKFDKYIQY